LSLKIKHCFFGGRAAVVVVSAFAFLLGSIFGSEFMSCGFMLLVAFFVIARELN
jgi:hypothetical protein